MTMKRLITVVLVVAFVGFMFGVIGANITSEPEITAVYKEPRPSPAPIKPVEVAPLKKLYPWRNVKKGKTILNCENEKQERIALACNIYFEARGESEKGQWAVALVTKNRVMSDIYPNTYHDVVWEMKRSRKTGRMTAQFSWALDGKPDMVKDHKAWRQAWEIAGVILNDNVEVYDFTNGALWYHADYVSPAWAKNKEVAAVIDKHIFYVASND